MFNKLHHETSYVLCGYCRNQASSSIAIGQKIFHICDKHCKELEDRGIIKKVKKESSDTTPIEQPAGHVETA